MKDYLATLVRDAPTPAHGRNVAREYLQARILGGLQRAGAMIPLAFHGGTALRFLYAAPRYSEDLDLALERDQERYDFRAYLRAIESDDHRDWLLLTYEQMTLEPEKMVRVMSRHWDLPDVDAMMRQVRLPSRTVTASTVAKVSDPDYLLKRWRSKINEEEERRVMRIPAAMDIDIYETGSFMPAAKVLH